MTVVISDMNGLSWSACVSVYRRLNHHGSLISERSNDVQREHGASGVQESERRLHRDQNARPSNPSAGGRERERHNAECTAGAGGAGLRRPRLMLSVCVTCSAPLVARRLSSSP